MLPTSRSSSGSLLSRRCRKQTVSSKLLREDALVSREVLRQDAGARLKLLGRITWMAAGIVVVNLLLLGLVVGAAVYKQYQPDQWFLRILASGPPVAIVGMLSAIVSHYWPRKTIEAKE